MADSWITLDVMLERRAFTLAARAEGTARRILLRGPSGSGKSSLLRSIVGIERLSAGVLRFEEETWLDSGKRVHKPAWERRVGWVPQAATLLPHLSVRENLALSPQVADPEQTERIAKSLEIDALLERRPRHLSGGEAQRVAIGRALLSRPRMLLLDEPYSALDEPLRERVSRVVDEFASTHQVPMLWVTHDRAVPEAWAGAIWHIDRGKLSA